MSQVWPWHSVQPGTPEVHHNDPACTEGSNIRREHRREGTGGRPLCARCARFQYEGTSSTGYSPGPEKPGHSE